MAARCAGKRRSVPGLCESGPAPGALAAALLGAGGSTPLEGRALAGLLARGRDAADLVPGAPGTVRRAVEVRLAGAGGREVVAKLDSGAGPVEANLAQLESAIVNLAVNARDAIDGHGTVTVSSSPVQLAGRQASRRGLAPGSYVEIRVADDGPGIPEELRERVFEPFFSTKRDRGGTGLGLSLVRLFARQPGGSAEIVSEAGRGTAVSLLLPTTAQPCTSGTHTMPLATLPTGTEHVAVLAADCSSTPAARTRHRAAAPCWSSLSRSRISPRPCVRRSTAESYSSSTRVSRSRATASSRIAMS